MSKNGTKFPLDCPFKGNRQNVFKKLTFLSHHIDDRFSALIFTELNSNPHPHLERGFRMRILDTKTMRIHADPQHWAEFRVDGIPCRWNSVSTEFRVDGIPFRRGNSMSTEFRGHPGVHNVEKKLKKVFLL